MHSSNFKYDIYEQNKTDSFTLCTKLKKNNRKKEEKKYVKSDSNK